MLLTVLLIVLILVLLGGFVPFNAGNPPMRRCGYGLGHGFNGVVFVLVVILVLLLVTGL